jgi:pseudouridine-5'-phosphate glycosidase
MIESLSLVIAPEVEAALSARRPVVALESTVIAHGLPRPRNIETAQRLEQVVREVGAIPATIAVLGGSLHVGLTHEQLQIIGTKPDVRKLSIRDLPIAVAKRLDGATTVATTVWIAHRAGISVFATGGIGGVHRGTLPDVSADLPQLAQTPITVVCSGAKIVLDLEATREWLETNGVTVIGYRSDRLPAFYSRDSNLPVDQRVDTPEEVAEIARARVALGLRHATIAAVPVPEWAEVPAALLEEVLSEALREAEQRRITGRDLTPFLLSRMAEKSGGATLRANIALLENNAQVASKIATALSVGRATGPT